MAVEGGLLRWFAASVAHSHSDRVRAWCLSCTEMMQLQDDYGNKIFKSIEITLVCAECLRTEHPERCRHKLASMPRWLSSQKVEVVRKLLAEARTTILCQHGSNS